MEFKLTEVKEIEKVVRLNRQSEYLQIFKEFENSTSKICLIETDRTINALYTSMRMVLKKHKFNVKLYKRNGKLYIKKGNENVEKMQSVRSRSQ